MAVMTALAIIGIGISVYSSWKQGQALKKAGKQAREASESQADLLDFNAEVAELQRKDALNRGADEESRFRTQVRGAIGTERTEFAANNVDVNFGSAADVQADTAFLGELDALTIRVNAAREAWGFQVEAEDTRRRAQITRKEGVQQELAGREAGNAAYLQGAGNLLIGSASLYSQRYGTGSTRPSTRGNLPSRTTAPLYGPLK